jgi:Mrp family chromosome partitioning ATPase
MAVGMHKKRLGRGLATLIGGPMSESTVVPTSHPEISTLPSEPIRYERYDEEGYDDDLFRILSMLWRRRYFLAAFCAVGVVVAGLVAKSIPSWYTSEVVLQARLPRQDPKLQSEALLDAASVVRTEADLVRSREIAESVVAHLGLAEDPNFAEQSSLLDRALALTTFWHSRPSFSNSSANSHIAADLLKNLDVSNDPKSLLIRISYPSTSPDQSARIANAFAEEYLRTREKNAAQRHLADLAATYGPKHPSVLQAQSQLEEALEAPSLSDSAQILTRASPPILPSGPNRRLIVAAAFVCSFAAGIVLVLILERANTSFRSDAELVTEAKARCLGMFAEGSAGPSFETARAIIIAAGLGAPSPQSKILLVTCTVADEGEFLVSTAIARSLVQMGKRALVVDLSGNAPPAPNSRTLKRVLNALENHPLKLTKKLTVLRGALATSGNQSPITSPSFTLLLEQAREQCDVVIIGTPPVMISADALCLGRYADFVLHVVRWNSTPRRAVLAALERLRNFGILVDGVILSRMHEKELWRLTGVAEKSQHKGRKDWKTRQATPKRGRAGSARNVRQGAEPGAPRANGGSTPARSQDLFATYAGGSAARGTPETAPAAAAAEMPAKAVAEPTQEALAEPVGEKPPEEGLSAEVLAFISAAAATGPNKGPHNARRKAPRLEHGKAAPQLPLNPAAE